MYSFWLYFIVLIILINSTKLCYYSFIYLLNLMFSFNLLYKIFHSLSIIGIGIFYILLFSIIFLSVNFYEKLSKYFLINVYRI